MLRLVKKKMSGVSEISSVVARGRLAVLTAHLTTATSSNELIEVAPSLEPNCLSAQVSPPGNLAGSLTVVDGRTGKKYQVPVSEDGTVKATDLKEITTGKNDKGLKVYDPGYLNTAPVRSSICYIDGDEGILRYRGYPIEELAENSTFVEVAYLLMYGNLPSENQLADWEFAISQHSAVPQGILDIIQAMPHDAHPMGVLVSAMSALSIFHPDANPALRGQDLYQSKQVRDKQIARVLGKAPTIAAAAYLRLAGRPPVLPSNNLSYAENFLYMLDSLGNRTYKPNPRLARVLDILFILHAEHEMNCSTAAARHLASSGVDVYTALAGAVGALYGPLHGGANEAVLKMLNEIGTVDNIPEFIEGVKNRKRKMSGFGHRVYKNYDPRAKVIKKLAEEVFSIVGRDPLIEVAVALEKAALSDEYFVKRKLYPNVDFYSGLIYRAMGFPTEFFTVLFAIPRMAGYLAHWRESLDDPDTKIMRPQQVYTGAWLRHYMSLQERMVSPGADRLWNYETKFCAQFSFFHSSKVHKKFRNSVSISKTKKPCFLYLNLGPIKLLMGFLSRLFGFGSKKPKNPQPQKEKQKRRSFIASLNSNSHKGTPSRHQVDDPNKHAIAVAAATAAVAEAALAAAHAAAEVVRLTSNVGRNTNVAHRLLTAELAAVKIQSAFRGYLARRALKALKALVKLQALVRGHMVRKQTANMLRRMQTLVRLQARARANRAQLSESFHSSSKSSLSSHPVPATPDMNDCQLRAYSSKFEGPSILKRCGSNSNFRDIINLDKAHGSSKWLDHWMEESLWNNRRDISFRNGHADDEKCDKILEVDTWKPHLNSQESKRTFQTSPNVFASDYNKESFMAYNSPSKHSTKAPNPIPIQATPSSGGVLSLGSFKLGRDETALRTADNSPQVHSLSSRPGSSARRGPFTPTRSEYAWGYFGGYSGHPNYMANTESFRAKVRSQSAPRQRLEFEKFGSTRRSVQGLWDAGMDSDKRFADQAEYRYKAYSASGQLNRVGSANLR